MENLTFDQLNEKDQASVLKAQAHYLNSIPSEISALVNRVQILKDNGFIEGVHFKYNCNKQTTKHLIFCGTSNGGGSHEYDIEYVDTSILILMPIYREHSNEISKQTYHIYFDDKGNIECNYLMDRRGFYKPKTILEKLTYKDACAIACKEREDKRIYIIEEALSEYREQYPMAEVTAKKNTQWRHNVFNQNADVVSILFESGSYMEIVIDSNFKREECVVKIHDVESSKLSIDDMLNKFSQQNLAVEVNR
jgi:DNA-binding Lrp family transcriptional regulator